jgi:predicted nuclease of restriction endonuclease-like RecB superfamily
MLTGNLVRVRDTRGRVIPLYLRRDDPYWLEMAESLLVVFREGIGQTRGALGDEIETLIGEGVQTLAHRGLAKVLEDRAEFEVVADVAPETVRAEVFAAAAAARRNLRQAPLEHGHRPPFHREPILADVGRKLGIEPTQIEAALFADLKDENRMIAFDDLSAQRLVDRYNVALAQAVLLRAVEVRVEIRGETPARYRQLFRALKFHRLLYRVQGSMAEGYALQLDGPLSLFAATNRYGVQMANFLPSLLLCRDYRLDAELRWGPRREPRHFHLERGDELVSHAPDVGTHTPAEIEAFLQRFRQVAPAWDFSPVTDILELGTQGVWIPDYRFVHRATGLDVFVEILGFWKGSSLSRLLELLPRFGPPRFVLAISDRLKVDEEALEELPGGVLRFKEIPSAPELAALLDRFLPGAPDLLGGSPT